MDNIKKVSHYNKGNIEVIDFIQDQNLNFALGNVVQYVCRAGFKSSNSLEDLKKAKQYLEYEMAEVAKKDKTNNITRCNPCGEEVLFSVLLHPYTL